MFIDEAIVELIAGSGGNGCLAFRREKYVAMGGPFGGNGGKGSDIIFKVDSGLNTLVDFKYKKIIKGYKGENGMGKGMHGKNAENIIIPVPRGTVVTDYDTGLVIADLTENNEEVVIAKGGRGGRGNMAFATQSNPAPHYAENGEPGEERKLKLELKVLADVGLVGLPSVGKSTILSMVSRARPKIADYHFTTLTPNLGVVRKRSGDGYVVADIPGLIEGASEGVGLGFDFLRHVERCRFLVHLVDASEENPFENYKKINLELEKHSEHLANLYQIVALNKVDAIDADRKQELFEQFKAVSPDVFEISAVTGENLDKLLDFMANKVDEIPKVSPEIVVEEDLGAYNNDDTAFEIFKVAKDTFIIEGGKIERLAGVTDERNSEQVIRFQNIMKGMGVFDELAKKGVKDGDTIIIGHLEFVFYSDEIFG